MALTDEREVDPYTALSGALRMTIDHAYNKQSCGRPPFQNGLAAYDAWINAFSKRTVDPFGNSYNVQVVSCARDFAWKFLDTIAQEWDGQEKLNQIKTDQPMLNRTNQDQVKLDQTKLDHSKLGQAKADYTKLDRKIRALAKEAAAHYKQVAQALHPLSKMFPFPHGDEPNKTEHADKSIKQLTVAKAAEEAGMKKLEDIYALLTA
jgi:hypothetical protein